MAITNPSFVRDHVNISEYTLISDPQSAINVLIELIDTAISTGLESIDPSAITMGEVFSTGGEKVEFKRSKTVETVVGKLRRQFKPKIGTSFRNLSYVEFTTGEATIALSNADEIQSLFPNTYGQPIVDINAPLDDVKSEEFKERQISSSCLPGKSTKQPSINLTDNFLNLISSASSPIQGVIRKSPLRVGVVFCGGHAAGGHNVITGLFDALKELNPESTLVGFTGGPKGIMINRYMELTADIIDLYRNTGGFDMIQSGRDKFHSEEQMMSCLKTVKDNKLDGLVMIGGDGTNTYAAILAEFFKKHESPCDVVGIPKTIDGDLQNECIEVSFGFDTAVKTFSHMISNIARDALSAAKAWHFIKLMGRDASQVTLDCAIMTQCNMALIGEEIKNEGMLLSDITEKMCDMIQERALNGRNYGVILIPEGVIQFIPTMRVLVDFLNSELKEGSEHMKQLEAFTELSEKINYVRNLLKHSSPTNLSNFDVLPRDIQAQLLLERDPHGHIQISQVPIEQLFMQICAQKLKTRKRYVASGTKFRANGHFFGYDGRSCYPSNFDAQYCYALGRVGAALISGGFNGYMARVYDLEKDVEEWKAGAVPITSLLNIEIRHEKPLPVIKKALVDVENGKKFAYFCRRRDEWEINDCYRYVGPVQFFGPQELTDVPPMNVLLKKTGDIQWPL